MKYYTTFKTTLCNITLVGDEDGLNHIHLHTGKDESNFNISPDWKENKKFFTKEITQLKEFSTGNRKTFDIKLNPEGTTFQNKVWEALSSIPYGETYSYKDIAAQIGNTKASRAVGMANSKNPIPIMVPCHRVIGANGKLTGFASGLKIKQQLLDLESQNT